MFTFRETCRDAGSINGKIKTVLSSRLAMHIGELCMRLGENEKTVRINLEMLVASGIVERLRPIGYEKDDMDFFRITGNGATVIRENYSGRETNGRNLMVVEDVVCNAG